MARRSRRGSAIVASIGMMAASLCAAAEPASEVAYGGWRRVVSAAQIAGGTGDQPFLMLPGAASRGTAFKVYDSARSRLVCCLAVASAALTRAELESRCQINPVWIEDLTTAIDGEALKPQVYAAERRGELAHYEFADQTDAIGGLVLKSTALATGKKSLRLDGQSYRIERKEEELGSGDGSWASYDLLPSSATAPPLRLMLYFRIY